MSHAGHSIHEAAKTWPNIGDNLGHNLRQVAALRSYADSLGCRAGQLALAWLLAQGEDVVPIPGTRSADRVAENAAAGDIALTAAQLGELDELLPAAGWSGDRRSFAVPVTRRVAAGRPGWGNSAYFDIY